MEGATVYMASLERHACECCATTCASRLPLLRHRPASLAETSCASQGRCATLECCANVSDAGRRRTSETAAGILLENLPTYSIMCQPTKPSMPYTPCLAV